MERNEKNRFCQNFIKNGIQEKTMYLRGEMYEDKDIRQRWCG